MSDEGLEIWKRNVKKDTSFYSINRYLGDGSNTTWDINFSGGYLDRKHIKAYSYNEGVVTNVELTFINDWQVSIKPAIANGVELYIYRDTPKDNVMVNFENASILTGELLNTVAKQAMFNVAEMVDRYDFDRIWVDEALAISSEALTTARDTAEAMVILDSLVKTSLNTQNEKIEELNNIVGEFTSNINKTIQEFDTQLQSVVTDISNIKVEFEEFKKEVQRILEEYVEDIAGFDPKDYRKLDNNAFTGSLVITGEEDGKDVGILFFNKDGTSYKASVMCTLEGIQFNQVVEDKTTVYKLPVLEGVQTLVVASQLDSKQDKLEFIGTGKVLKEGAAGLYTPVTKTRNHDWNELLPPVHSSEHLQEFEDNLQYVSVYGFSNQSRAFLRVPYRANKDDMVITTNFNGAVTGTVVLTDTNTRTDANGILHKGTKTPIKALNVSDMSQQVVDRDDITVTSGAVFRSLQGVGKGNITMGTEGYWDSDVSLATPTNIWAENNSSHRSEAVHKFLGGSYNSLYAIITNLSTYNTINGTRVRVHYRMITYI